MSDGTEAGWLLHEKSSNARFSADGFSDFSGLIGFKAGSFEALSPEAKTKPFGTPKRSRPDEFSRRRGAPNWCI